MSCLRSPSPSPPPSDPAADPVPSAALHPPKPARSQPLPHLFPSCPSLRASLAASAGARTSYPPLSSSHRHIQVQGPRIESGENDAERRALTRTDAALTRQYLSPTKPD
ncbi:hypothetical protein DFH09DRAFT_1086550 [Mycena vulgaris]|nr:hypothetical protein DFH09DRAFT_1086550 [Mycena vulgaris]